MCPSRPRPSPQDRPPVPHGTGRRITLVSFVIVFKTEYIIIVIISLRGKATFRISVNDYNNKVATV